MHYKKTYILIVLILFVIFPSLLFGEAGLSEMARVHRFWLMRPFALSQFEDMPQETYLFVGYETDDLFFNPFAPPDHIDVIETRIERVKSYGKYQLWLVYGTTWDNKWFIATKNYGIETKTYDNEDIWKKEIISLGGPSRLYLKTFNEGYRNYNLKQLLWLLIRIFFTVLLISIPWLIMLKKYKEQHIALSGRSVRI